MKASIIATKGAVALIHIIRQKVNVHNVVFVASLEHAPLKSCFSLSDINTHLCRRRTMAKLGLTFRHSPLLGAPPGCPPLGAPPPLNPLQIPLSPPHKKSTYELEGEERCKEQHNK